MPSNSVWAPRTIRVYPTLNPPLLLDLPKWGYIPRAGWGTWAPQARNFLRFWSKNEGKTVRKLRRDFRIFFAPAARNIGTRHARTFGYSNEMFKYNVSHIGADRLRYRSHEYNLNSMLHRISSPPYQSWRFPRGLRTQRGTCRCALEPALWTGDDSFSSMKEVIIGILELDIIF